MTETGIEMLKWFEGFEAKAYRDVVGKWTIGYGHLILPHEGHLMDAELSEEGAESLLITDVSSHEEEMLKLAAVPLREWEADALTSFVYNVGGSAFRNSTLRRVLQHNSPPSVVADQFTRWVFAGGKPYPGLVRRRNVEAVRYLGGSLTLLRSVFQ